MIVTRSNAVGEKHRHSVLTRYPAVMWKCFLDAFLMLGNTGCVDIGTGLHGCLRMGWQDGLITDRRLKDAIPQVNPQLSGSGLKERLFVGVKVLLTIELAFGPAENEHSDVRPTVSLNGSTDRDLYLSGPTQVLQPIEQWRILGYCARVGQSRLIPRQREFREEQEHRFAAREPLNQFKMLRQVLPNIARHRLELRYCESHTLAFSEMEIDP